MEQEHSVRAALATILEESTFKQSPMMSKFLIYVVEETLAGRADKLKGYTIAIEALGKSTQFDPQIDPTVRVVASRVRRALELAAARPAAGQSVRITLPSGRYVPRFETVAVAQTPEVAPPAPLADGRLNPDPAQGEGAPGPATDAAVAAPSLPGLVPRGRTIFAMALGLLMALGLGAGFVWMRTPPDRPANLPEAVGGPYIPYPDRMNGPHASALLVEHPLVQMGPITGDESPVLARFADLLMNALARFDDMLDVAQTGETRAMPRPTYTVSFHPGVLRSGTADRALDMVDVRVTRAESRRIVWVRSVVAADLQDPTALAGIVESIATELAVPYGVLFADVRGTRASELHFAETQFPCVHLALEYWQHYGGERNAAVIRCLQATIAGKPDFAAAHANLAMAQIEAFRNDYTTEAANLLELAHGHALQAIQLAPASARARQSLVAVLFTRGEQAAGLEVSRKAVELNPFDGEIRADYGARLIQAGFHEQGEAELKRALSHAAVVPPWHWLFLFVAAELKGDVAMADAYARQIISNDYPMGLLARTVVARRTGREADAQRLLSRLKELDPVLASAPHVAFQRRGYVAKVIDDLMARLSLAGIRS